MTAAPISFGTELQSLVRSYLRGDISHEMLRRWLDTHAQDAADSDDSSAKQLADRAWAMHVELRDQLRSEDELRTELADLIAHPAAAS